MIDMRLEGRVKMGYYPTPLSVVDRIRTFLIFPKDSVSLFDPCCGEGLALQKLCGDANVTTYGIELDQYRAEQAREKLDYVIKGSYEDAKVSNSAFSCLFLNPPYDWETLADTEFGSEKKEKTFLKGTIKYLQPAGTLIYIIPQHRLSGDIAKLLSYYFEDNTVFRFPDDEYKQYRQIVLFGLKKHKDSLNDNDFHRLKNVPNETLTALPYSETPLYTLPPSKNVYLFRSSIIDQEELEKELEGSILWHKLNGYTQTDNDYLGRPALPLHTGHLGLLLANGCLDGIVGEGLDKHIVRGKVEKITNTFEEYQEGTRIERELDSYRVSIKILKKDGDIVTLM